MVKNVNAVMGEVMASGVGLKGLRRYPLESVVRYDLNWQEPEWLSAGVREMHREAQWFLNDLAHRRGRYAMQPRWLVLCGQCGCGKSHLAWEIRNVAHAELGFTERTAQFWKCSRYAERLRNGYWDFQDHLMRLPLLVLDDVGAEHGSELLRGKLFDLLDNRLDKWTVITTNLSAGEVAEQLDARIASRLRRGNNVLVEVRDAEDFCWRARGVGVGLPGLAAKRRVKEVICMRKVPGEPPATEEEREEFLAFLRGEEVQGEKEG